jgi:ArsR family transcriptional regulator, arsenate/arsenite/antimonite-responsive transcriptional repressor
MPITKYNLYPQQLNQISHIFKVLSCPARLTILKYLLDHGSSNNKELVEYLQLKQSTVSEHLKQLISIDLVVATQLETSMLYRTNIDIFQNTPMAMALLNILQVNQ